MAKKTDHIRFALPMSQGYAPRSSTSRIEPQIVNGACESKGPNCQKTCAQPSGVEEVTNCSNNYCTKQQRY